ncbi:MAG: hypothetical protein VYD95_04925 [Pseudomonadota bacterium]|nr:hypothetical protein [Pseudomonadota bacterium]
MDLLLIKSSSSLRFAASAKAFSLANLSLSVRLLTSFLKVSCENTSS